MELLDWIGKVTVAGGGGAVVGDTDFSYIFWASFCISSSNSTRHASNEV